MIRIIAAIDDKRGIANDEGIPWDIPADQQYYRAKTENSIVVMGYRTYMEYARPLREKHNYVFSPRPIELRDGFEQITDLDTYLRKTSDDIWIIGGAQLFATSIGFVGELYLTRVDGAHGCTKFFPAFKHDFELVSEDGPHEQNGYHYSFTIWKRKNSR